MLYITSKIYILYGHDLLQESKHIISFAMRSNFKLNVAKRKKEIELGI